MFKTELSASDNSLIEWLITSQENNIIQQENTVYEAVIFEEDVSQLEIDLLEAFELKQHFLKATAADCIQLQIIESLGISLIAKRKKILSNLSRLLTINVNDSHLNFIFQSYLCCLSFDESNELHFQDRRYSQMNSIVKDVFSNNSSLIFVSLTKDNFGMIQNVSNQFSKVFNYSKQEIIGQNCSCLMPRNIGTVHNTILSNFISKGSFETENFKKSHPLFIINKQGFLMEIEMSLQLTLAQQDSVGVSGLIRTPTDQNLDIILLADIKQDYLISGCTAGIFNTLLFDYLTGVEESNFIYLQQFFPLLELFIKEAKNDNIISQHETNDQTALKPVQEFSLRYSNLIRFQSKLFETVVFMPKKGKQQQSSASRLFQKPGSYLTDPLEKWQYFNLQNNDVYIVSGTLQITSSGELYEMCKMSFKSIKKLEGKICQLEQIRKLIVPKLQEIFSSKLEAEIMDIFTVPSNYQQQALCNKINLLNDSPSNIGYSDCLRICTNQTSTQIIEEASHVQEDQQLYWGLIQTNRNSNNNEQQIFSSMHIPLNDLPMSQRELLAQTNTETMVLVNDKPLQQMLLRRSTVSKPQVQQHLYTDILEPDQQIENYSGNLSILKSREASNFNNNIISNLNPIISPRFHSDHFQNTPFSQQILNNQFFSSSKNNKNEQQQNSLNQSNASPKDNSTPAETKIIDSLSKQQALQQLQSERQHSITSSRSSYIEQRKLIRSAFQHQKYSYWFEFILIISAISLISLVCIILIVHFQLSDKFAIQKRTLYYISWAMNLRTSESRTFKDHMLQRFITIPLFGHTADQSNYLPLFQARLEENYQRYRQQIIDVVEEPLVDLNLVQTFSDFQMTVGIYKTDTDYVLITTGVQQVLDIHTLTIFQFMLVGVINNGNLESVLNLNLFNNFQLLIKPLAAIQAAQENDYINVFNQIDLIVTDLTITICLISAVVSITILSVYSIFQRLKERIYQLFATIDPMSLKKIHKVLLTGILQLQNNRKASLSYQKTKYLGIQKQPVQFTQDSTSRPLNVIIKDVNLVDKKKSISATSTLAKWSNLLFIKCIFIYIILIIYPITNLITTRSLISAEGSSQSLTGVIQTLKSQLSSSINTLLLLVQSELNLNGEIQYYQKYKVRYQTVYQNVGQVLSQFQSFMETQIPKSRFQQDEFDGFFFDSITTDTCSAFERFPNNYNSSQFSIEKCRKVFGGSLSQGLIHSSNKFFSFYTSTEGMFLISDQTQRLSELSLYFQQNDLFEANEFYEMLMRICDALTSFLVQNNNSFFDVMIEIQNILMYFEFLIIGVVYQFGMVQFFKKTQRDFKSSKEIISVLQIPEIIENSYILNYLK